jgi:hypothetical protein
MQCRPGTGSIRALAQDIGETRPGKYIGNWRVGVEVSQVESLPVRSLSLGRCLSGISGSVLRGPLC